VLTRLLTPAMVTAGRGHVVLVGSISGKVASPGTALYTAAKFGIRGFAHAMNQDLHARGVGVSVVQPGFIRDAGMFADSGAKVPRGLGTVSPAQVVAGVIGAIEHNRPEVNVAAFATRLGATVGSLFPQFATRVQRRVGVDATAREIVEAQRHKR
jgi:short-subunit dehydrogenase